MDISLLKNEKTFKLPSRATFAIPKFLYLFRISQLARKFLISHQKYQVVTSTISGTCHHEVNLARVNSFNNGPLDKKHKIVSDAIA